jgi:poly-gamma-glutamate synthesis protein (capsule biosynthesis protein)
MKTQFLLDGQGRLRLRRARPALRLLLSGDVCPIDRIERALIAGDLDGVFGDTLGLFRQADLAVINLESPLCRTKRPIVKCGPNFRTDPAVAAALVAAGVDVCCLANNHVMDQGPAGLRETLRSLDAAGLWRLGAGSDQTAVAGPLTFARRGIRLALLNFGIVEGALAADGPGAAKIDVLTVRQAVARAANGGAVVISILHAGREEVLFPSPGMQQFCRELIDAGAAAVIAHHPHVPQGMEIWSGRPIAYSLGNFLFGEPGQATHTDTSFLLELGLAPGGVVELAIHPVRGGSSGRVMLLRGRERSSWLGFFREISQPLGNKSAFQRLWTEQCRPQLAAWHGPRLARAANLASPRVADRRRAEVTMLNLMEDLEHGEVIKSAIRARATGRAALDRPARRTLDALIRRLCALGAGQIPVERRTGKKPR